MPNRFVSFVRSFFSRKPVKLAIVRRYCDANGSYVGELYMDNGKGCYGMIGVSLDSWPMDTNTIFCAEIDTENDFLAPMPAVMIRVGAISPADNNAVRKMVARLPRKRMEIAIQNRFIENVQEKV